MKKFFAEVFKLSLFIGLALAAIYLTGNWDWFLREVAALKLSVEEHLGLIKNHVETTSKLVKSA